MVSTPSTTPGHPILALPGEDLDFILEFVLCSGSLKDQAKSYGVSYPTIRARLDRLIERLRVLRDGRAPDPLTELLASLVERGEVTPAGARRIRDAARTLRAAADQSGGAS